MYIVVGLSFFVGEFIYLFVNVVQTIQFKVNEPVAPGSDAVSYRVGRPELPRDAPVRGHAALQVSVRGCHVRSMAFREELFQSSGIAMQCEDLAPPSAPRIFDRDPTPRWHLDPFSSGGRFFVPLVELYPSVCAKPLHDDLQRRKPTQRVDG